MTDTAEANEMDEAIARYDRTSKSLADENKRLREQVTRLGKIIDRVQVGQRADALREIEK